MTELRYVGNDEQNGEYISLIRKSDSGFTHLIITREFRGYFLKKEGEDFTVADTFTHSLEYLTNLFNEKP